MSGVIYNSNLEQIKEMFAIDPVRAGELAISFCEMALTGQASTDDPDLKIILAGFRPLVENNKKKYNDRVESSRLAEISKFRLDEIADMLKAGRKQAEISRALDIKSSTLNDRVRKIREKYPELLGKPDKIYPIETGQKYPDPENSAEETEFRTKNRTKMSDNSENPENSAGQMLKTGQKCPENPENPVHDNDNDNDNDNVTPETQLPFVSVEALTRMGCRYLEAEPGIIEVVDTGMRFRTDWNGMF